MLTNGTANRDKQEELAPALFFAPFVSSRMAIRSDWIDYNGHLNMAYYHVLFDQAVDEAFGLCGLGPDYLRERGHSFFLVESRIRYRRELKLEDTVRVTLQLVDFDEKRLHYVMEIRHAQEGWLSAACENLSINVDMATRRAVASQHPAGSAERATVLGLIRSSGFNQLDDKQRQTLLQTVGGTDHPSREARDNVQRLLLDDGYAAASPADQKKRLEDFGESYALYQMTKGTPEFDAARAKHPARFAILDELTKGR